MKKTLLCLLLLSVSNLIVFSQSKDYFVVFCGMEASYNTLGHAFIMTGKGDPFTCSIDNGDGEAFGLYAASSDADGTCKPKGYNAAKSYFVGQLKGCLFNDISTKVSNYLTVRCSFEEYLQVHMEIENWKKKSYELKKQDCLSFVISIANLFSSQLSIPERSDFENFPNKFILQLKKDNPQIKK